LKENLTLENIFQIIKSNGKITRAMSLILNYSEKEKIHWLNINEQIHIAHIFVDY